MAWSIRDRKPAPSAAPAARVVVNAAGPFCDDVRRLADPATTPLVAASQGSHVVLDRSFLPADDALLVPKTPDGRVLFAIPWHGHTLVGTTDVPISNAPAEPRPTPDEIDFILETAGRYLSQRPQRADVLSTFAGSPAAGEGRRRAHGGAVPRPRRFASMPRVCSRSPAASGPRAVRRRTGVESRRPRPAR